LLLVFTQPGRSDFCDHFGQNLTKIDEKSVRYFYSPLVFGRPDIYNILNNKGLSVVAWSLHYDYVKGLKCGLQQERVKTTEVSLMSNPY